MDSDRIQENESSLLFLCIMVLWIPHCNILNHCILDKGKSSNSDDTCNPSWERYSSLCVVCPWVITHNWLRIKQGVKRRAYPVLLCMVDGRAGVERIQRTKKRILAKYEKWLSNNISCHAAVKAHLRKQWVPPTLDTSSTFIHMKCCEQSCVWHISILYKHFCVHEFV